MTLLILNIFYKKNNSISFNKTKTKTTTKTTEKKNKSYFECNFSLTINDLHL